MLAPEHEFIANNELRIANHAEVKKYIEIAKKKSDEDRSAENKEKTGVELKGIKAINPANKEEIPIWVADYVFGGYGTGAIMAVPAHDERDFEFAKKFNLPIRYVVAPHFIDHIYPPREGEPFEPRKAVQPYVYNPKTSSYLFLDWKVTTWKGPVSGGIEEGESTVEAAQREVHEETGYKNIRFIRELGSPIKCDFYHPHKKVNRSGEFIGLLFELVDEAKDEVSEEEKKKHEFCWVLEQETLNFINEGITFFKRIPQSNLAYVGNGTLINSEKFSGKKSEEVKKEITDFVGGKWKVQYRLRDWLISRQRYWGPPIPIIYCRNCWEVTSNKEQGTRKKMREGIDYAMFDGEEYVIHPLPEEDLPVELPYVKDFRPQGKGESPLASVESFYKVKCPACKGEARRETDVSDTFLDSAWYFLRYPSVTRNKEQGTRDKLPWDKEITRRWLPVNMYIGGAEHSVLHLLYSRFITMALHDMKLLHFEEPFTKFRAHGLITKDGAKMSKSKGNVVTPDEYFGKFGADVMRMYLAFMAPLDQGGDFREGGILGPERFLKRVWKFYSDKRQGTSDKEQVEELERLAHRAAKKVTEDIENLHYNTAISALMVLLNKMEEVCPPLSHAACPMFLKLLAPFAPFMTEEIWQNMAKSREQRAKSKFKSIHQESWPEYDPKLIIEDTFTLVIQVNGKVRDTVGGVQANISEDEARALALSRERILAYAGGKEPKKVIYIPNRLVNVVI
ncbi:MAG: class I tRNA ligase family protein [Candidatus Liptonbacteria bacterium]|nr:class I tRNA ligase family protein [Candidatus Liptonbacteria bacterium]